MPGEKISLHAEVRDEAHGLRNTSTVCQEEGEPSRKANGDKTLGPDVGYVQETSNEHG